MDHPARYDHLNELMLGLGREAPGVMEAFLPHACGQPGRGSPEHGCQGADGARHPHRRALRGLRHLPYARRPRGGRYPAGDRRDRVGVAVMMGGGPAVVYGGQALEALEALAQVGVKTP